MRNILPSRASNAWTRYDMSVGTIHDETDGAWSALQIASRGAAMRRPMRVVPLSRSGGRTADSLPVGKLPQLDLVAFRVHHPAELAVLGVVGLLEHIASFPAHRLKQGVQVGDAVELP